MCDIKDFGYITDIPVTIIDQSPLVFDREYSFIDSAGPKHV